MAEKRPCDPAISSDPGTSTLMIVCDIHKTRHDIVVWNKPLDKLKIHEFQLLIDQHRETYSEP